MEWLTDPETWLAFVTLAALEIVLGIDNVIFISILAGKLPVPQQKSARRSGIGLAVISRLLLLLSLSWIIRLTQPLFSLAGFEVSGRDLVLFAGGLFLLGKATSEIHQKLEGVTGGHSRQGKITFTGVLLQVLLLDVVFSLDSVITAVGIADHLPVMMAAIVTAAACMIVLSDTISDFVERHPTVKMLALSFLLLIGFTLVVESLHQHIPKGYIYFAMGFSVFVEMLNLRVRKVYEPVELHKRYG
ncbi:MAG: Integral membrane protein TerC [Anaerolineae bacterium]|nr:MAG: Integral membrane protein TerC [Anaerolineae bacterium]